MVEKQLDPRPFFVLGVVAVLGIGGWIILGGSGPQHNYHEFASCLAAEGATMYGFDTCPHCNKQKEVIGREAFTEELDEAGYYVRCRPQSEAGEKLGERSARISSVAPLTPNMTQGEACSINVGQGTPTWVINGEKYVGEQSIATLADASGCQTPANYTATDRDVGGFTEE